MDGNELDGSELSEDERRQRTSVFMWMRQIEERIGFIENVVVELLTKLKDAGMIVDEDEDDAEEEVEDPQSE